MSEIGSRLRLPWVFERAQMSDRRIPLPRSATRIFFYPVGFGGVEHHGFFAEQTSKAFSVARVRPQLGAKEGAEEGALKCLVEGSRESKVDPNDQIDARPFEGGGSTVITIKHPLRLRAPSLVWGKIPHPRFLPVGPPEQLIHF